MSKRRFIRAVTFVDNVKRHNDVIAIGLISSATNRVVVDVWLTVFHHHLVGSRREFVGDAVLVPEAPTQILMTEVFLGAVVRDLRALGGWVAVRPTTRLATAIFDIVHVPFSPGPVGKQLAIATASEVLVYLEDEGPPTPEYDGHLVSAAHLGRLVEEAITHLNLNLLTCIFEHLCDGVVVLEPVDLTLSVAGATTDGSFAVHNVVRVLHSNVIGQMTQLVVRRADYLCIKLVWRMDKRVSKCISIASLSTKCDDHGTPDK